MTKDEILLKHKATINSASEYDHTSIVCNVAETWALIEAILESHVKEKAKLEYDINYWKLSFKKQCQASGFSEEYKRGWKDRAQQSDLEH